jgi:hypothetical protein
LLPRVPLEEANARCNAHLREYWEAQQRQREEQRRQEREAFFTKYNAYLRTSAWRSLRHRVLQRARGICEACLIRRATQVHHTTYEHVFAEFAFELVAICDACHSRLHAQEEDEMVG